MTDQRPSQAGPVLADQARAVSAYSTREKIGRVLWNYLGQPAMRCTFHNWYAIRRAILRLFKCNIAPDARVWPTVRIEQPWNLTLGPNSSIADRAIIYCLGRITIGANCSISQYAHLCAGTHDHTRADLPLLRPPITIENEVWVAADAFIGPNVTIREGCVIGARSTVFKDTKPWTIYAGNPAQPLKARTITRADHGPGAP